MPNLRLPARGLLLLLAAAFLLVADYLFITNYAEKAKQESAQKLQEQLLSYLTGMPENMYKPGRERQALNQRLQILGSAASSVAYLVLWVDSLPIAEYAKKDIPPEMLSELSAAYTRHGHVWPVALESVPVALPGMLFQSYSVALPHAKGVVAVYAVPNEVVDEPVWRIYRLNFYMIMLMLLFMGACTILWGGDAHHGVLAVARGRYKPGALFALVRKLMDYLGDGMLVFNRHGELLHYSPLADELLGLGAAVGSPPVPVDEMLRKTGFTLEQEEAFHSLLSSEGVLTELTIGSGRDAVTVSAASAFMGQYIVCALHNLTAARAAIDQAGDAALELAEVLEKKHLEIAELTAKLEQAGADSQAAEEALARATERYRELVNNSADGIIQITPDGRLLAANPAMARIFGYHKVEDLLAAYQEPGGHITYTPEMHRAICDLLEVRGWADKLEFQATMHDGSPVWVEANARRVLDRNGSTVYYEAFVTDITSRKQTEEQLVYQAFHDHITGLPNRALFLDRLRMGMRRSRRQGVNLFAVLYIDLDHFKIINDTFGHNAGDIILGTVTERILQCIREADTVARFSGDEFAVLLTDLEKPAQVVHIAQRISDTVRAPIIYDGQELSIGTSIGIVLNGSNYETPEEVLRDAETAMYRSKMRGRRRFTVFNKRMREETMVALVMESDLRGAVERKEIEVHYQPLVQMSDGRVYGFEALMRWRRNGEIVGPLSFIPLAEETGLINELGMEVLELACRRIVEWNKELGHSNYCVHINVSGKQLMAKRFWHDVKERLELTGVNPRQLIFEITESVFLDYGSQVIGVMSKVCDCGIRFCLDDFGTGFSSFSYLRLMPLDSLKVDRSFIVDLPSDVYSEAILRNLVSLGNDLGLHVIAEGIDHPRQIDALQAIGCVFAQGYYFAKPLIPEEALKYAQAHGCTDPDELILS